MLKYTCLAHTLKESALIPPLAPYFPASEFLPRAFFPCGTLPPGAHYLPGKIASRGLLSSLAHYLSGELSPGHIVLEAYCLGVGYLWGMLTSGRFNSGILSTGSHCHGADYVERIVLGQIVSLQVVLGHHVPHHSPLVKNHLFWQKMISCDIRK